MCTICNDPRRADIDSALESGDSTHAVAKRFALSQSTVQRHAKHREAGVPKRAESKKASRAKRPASRAAAADSPASPARARADEGDPPPAFPRGREARVVFVIDLMTANRWEKGVTGPALAEAAGLAVTTLEDIAAEASRRVRSYVDPDLARAKIATAFGEGIGLALGMARDQIDPETGERHRGDPRGLATLASIGKAYGELAGATAAKRVDVTSAGEPLMGFPSDHPLALLGRAPTKEELRAYVERGEVPKLH